MYKRLYKMLVLLFFKWTPTFTHSQLTLRWNRDWCRDGNDQAKQPTPQPISKHSFSRPSATAQEAFPDFTTTERQLDGVYASQDPTRRPAAPEHQKWRLRETGTIDNGAVHGTKAASPSSIPSIMFIAHYSALKRLFYPGAFNWDICFPDIFLIQQMNIRFNRHQWVEEFMGYIYLKTMLHSLCSTSAQAVKRLSSPLH